MLTPNTPPVTVTLQLRSGECLAVECLPEGDLCQHVIFQTNVYICILNSQTLGYPSVLGKEQQVGTFFVIPHL